MANKQLTVYFSGTSFRIGNTSFVSGDLYDSALEDDTQFKMGFDGCAIQEGMLKGGIFGFGLDKQCERVIAKVRELLQDPDTTITVTAYGHSRGGIACFLLALRLANWDRVRVHLVVHDPVPGNWRNTACLDVVGVTLGGETKDLSHCSNLDSVLCIYPVLPLSAIMAHAPMFPKFPEHCQVIDELTLGIHALAQITGNPNAEVARILAIRFLADKGVRFPDEVLQSSSDLSLLSAYEESISLHLLNPNIPASKSRKTHIRGILSCQVSIEFSGITPGCTLTPTHQRLKEAIAPGSSSTPSDQLAPAMVGPSSSESDEQEQPDYCLRFNPPDFRRLDHAPLSEKCMIL